MSIVQIPSDPDVGRLSEGRPSAVERARAQMIRHLHPVTVDRLLHAIGIEPHRDYPVTIYRRRRTAVVAPARDPALMPAINPDDEAEQVERFDCCY